MSRLSNTTCIAAAWALSSCATPPPPAAPASPPPPPALVLRADPPGPAPAASVRPPAFRVAVLDNGLTVYALDSNAVQSPIVQVELITLGGAAADPVDHAGLTLLSYLSTYHGGGKWQGRDLQRRLTQISAGLDVDVQPDHGRITVLAPARNMQQATRLLAALVMQPHLHPPSFDRLKTLVEERSTVKTSDPMDHARHILGPLTFGRVHPYGRKLTGTKASMANISAQLVELHRAQLLRPDRSAVIISGAVSPGEAINMARSAFERWKVVGKASLPSVAVVPAPPDTRVHLLDRPRATQTLVCALTTVMGREDPDAPAMEVAVHILAGAFDSRLQTAMREEGGYTYGVQSAIDWFHGSSRLSICAQVERGETVRAAQEILRQVEGMRSAPPDEAAVTRALEGLRGSAAGHYETLGGSAAEAREAFLRAATWSAASSTEEGAAAPVSAARVAAVAERLLRADRIALLLVGDARRLRPVLGDLDRGVVIQTF